MLDAGAIKITGDLCFLNLSKFEIINKLLVRGRHNGQLGANFGENGRLVTLVTWTGEDWWQNISKVRKEQKNLSEV